MIDVRDSFDKQLDEETLHRWHKLLFGESNHINTGVWRKSDEPMRVVSGNLNNEEVHFEAPPSSTVPKEMKNFVL